MVGHRAAIQTPSNSPSMNISSQVLWFSLHEFLSSLKSLSSSSFSSYNPYSLPQSGKWAYCCLLQPIPARSLASLQGYITSFNYPTPRCGCFRLLESQPGYIIPDRPLKSAGSKPPDLGTHVQVNTHGVAAMLPAKHRMPGHLNVAFCMATLRNHLVVA